MFLFIYCIRTSMSWIRIRISPYESGSDINRTNLDPRIRIHITGSSLCPLYQFFFCFDKLYSILTVIFLAKFLKFTDLYCTFYVKSKKNDCLETFCLMFVFFQCCGSKYIIFGFGYEPLAT